MKKTLLWCLLCAAVSLLLAGCGAAQPQAVPTASPAPTPEITATPAPTPPLPELPDAAALEALTPADFDCLVEEYPTARSTYTLTTADGQALDVTLLEGAADGPTIYIVGGVHGNELAGWYAGTLLKQADLKAGRVYLAAPANPWGAENDRRDTADGRDLNRNFPGDAAGNPAQQRAAALWNDITEKAPALVLDLHEARQWNDGSDELGNSIICQDMQPVADVVWGLLEASANGQLHGGALDLFGSPPVGSLNRTLTLEAGIPVITVETSRAEPLPQRVKNQLEITEYVLKNQGLR